MTGISAILDIANESISESIFEGIGYNGSFTNVVDTDPRQVVSKGLVLLFLNNELDGKQLVYLCALKKQLRVATGQVRVKGLKFVDLRGLDMDELIAALPKKSQARAGAYFQKNYQKLSPKLGVDLFDALLILYPDLEDQFKELSLFLQEGSRKASSAREDDAAIEKDALGLSLDIFGVDRSDVLRSWQGHAGSIGNSFLNGLNEFAVYEDDVIAHDLHKFPGFESVDANDITGVVQFESVAGDKLTVINANRKPLEKALGVDLIYFHRGYASFVMVQYKMMDVRNEGEDELYFNPKQKSHILELGRLQKLKKTIDALVEQKGLANYRFSDCPLFFKLCRKFELKSTDHSLAPGMYIPLDQWELLLQDASTVGRSGGRQFGYHTLNKRYMGKETFVDLLQAGFIGTRELASQKIGLFVEDAIKKGHSVMVAIEERKSPRFTRKQKVKRNLPEDNYLDPDNEGDDDGPF